MTANVVHPAELEAMLQARVAVARSTRPKARRAPRTGRRFSIVRSAFATSLLATALFATLVFADGGDLNVEVDDREGYAVDTTNDDAIVEYIGDQNETFGSSGSGVFDSFVRLQAAPDEAGYNTDGDREFDTKAGAFTHSILVSEIPVVTIDGEGDQLFWELFADINDSDNTPLISLNDLEVYFTEDPEITDYPFAGTATNVYDFSGTILINDVNQGSGRGDLRYNIPLTGITIPDDCDYGNTTCETYFVLYSEWGDTGGTYTSDGGFEEWKVKQYPTLKIVKITVGGDGTFDYTVTGPSAPLSPTPSITTTDNTGETITYVVDEGTYTIEEDGPPAGWTLNGATCSFDGDPGEAYTPGDDLVLGDQTHVVCTFTNTQDGRIEIEKQTIPDGSTADFTFAGDVGGTLSDGESAGADVAPGSYASTETVPDGWTLTSIVCDDSDSTGATGTGIASFVVAAGETVRCVFTNTQDVVNEGCTPGFWQGGLGSTLWNTANDPDWTAAGGAGTNPFITTQTFVSFFPSSGSATVDDMQMIEIVGTGGTNSWARKAARDLIAAYLNASFGLDYPYDTATILADWNTAVAGGTAGFETFHAKYSAANELGCPIGAPASSDVGIGAVLIAGSLASVRLVKSRRRRIG